MIRTSKTIENLRIPFHVVKMTKKKILIIIIQTEYFCRNTNMSYVYRV